MDEKTRQYLIYGLAGGIAVGLLGVLGAAFIPGLSGALLFLIQAGFLVSSVLFGLLIGYLAAQALPEMLPHYRAEHDKLRQTSGQLRRYLKKLKCDESAYKRLNEILHKDAQLRHQATMLKKVISESAQVNWQDRLAGGKQLLKNYLDTPHRGRMSGMEWTISSYRAKLDRQVHDLAVQRQRATDSMLKRELDTAYNIKYEELSNFVRFEMAIERIEVELTKIRASFDSALLQTTRLAHIDMPQLTTLSLPSDTLLNDLHQELNSFDEALREVLEVKTNAEIIETLSRANAVVELESENQQHTRRT